MQFLKPAAVALLAFAWCPSAALPRDMAAEMESAKMANELGTVLGSERWCNLSFDQTAVAAWIDDNVRAEDMGFASMLDLMTQTTGMQVSAMSGSSLTAHCRQIERTARHYGFIQ